MPNKTGVFTQRWPDETVPTDGKQQSSSAALHKGTLKNTKCVFRGGGAVQFMQCERNLLSAIADAI